MPTAAPALQMMQYGVHTDTNEDNRGRLSQTVSDVTLSPRGYTESFQYGRRADTGKS